jgi:peptidoglycan/xylan/chitin deacetylase (PgdA/CDA1 family)
MFFAKSPALFKWLYPTLTWHESREEKCIYLSFDDGPIPIVTPFVLKTLKKFDVKATFFCIGDNVRKHPEIFEEIRKDGHALGNHTFHHVNGWKTDDETYLNEFEKCQTLVESTVFRPPYGRIKRSQISKLKKLYPELKIVMWDVLSHDYHSGLSPKTCLNNVIKHAENGSIVVFHDSLKAQKRLEYALPRALDYWIKKGYQFKTW